MDIVYAAEKPSIADLLSHRLHRRIDAQDIDVCDNPAQTGSFLVRWRLDRYLVSPSGEVVQIGPRAEPRPRPGAEAR